MVWRDALGFALTRVPGDGVYEALCGAENRTLRKLVMEGLSLVMSGTVVAMAECLPELTHLNLSYCVNAVTDWSLQAIFQNLTKLRSLRLANCNAITDAGLTGMGSGVSDTLRESQMRGWVWNCWDEQKTSESLGKLQNNWTVQQLLEQVKTRVLNKSAPLTNNQARYLAFLLVWIQGISLCTCGHFLTSFILETADFCHL